MIRIACGIALTLALALPAAAEVKTGTAPERFDAADTNKDGKIDSTEYEGFVEELVLLHDANRDGKLAQSELPASRDPAKFTQIDANKDGFLTAEEVRAFSQSDFAAIDANRDGGVDRSEAAAHR